MKYMNETTDKFSDYIAYITEHKNNVLKAWQEVQEKCKHEPIVIDDWTFGYINNCIKEHDLSKFSKEEFTQYRLNFFPCQDEQKNKEEFEIACKHHYENNSHHWQYWVNEDDSFKNGCTVIDYTDKDGNKTYNHVHRLCSYVEMICDWQAMGYKFGDTALDYYNKHKDEIKLPDDEREFVERILNQLCGNDEGGDK